MQHYQHNFKKQFGQNFINHIPSLLRTIDALELKTDDNVLEIGPGDGRFSEVILSSTQNLTLVEIDSELIGYLNYVFKDYSNLKVINSDILEFNLDVFKDKQYKVFGALPYNISKPIIAKFLETDIKPELMVFVTQLEVAEDYCSKTPKSSFLSNYAQIYADFEFMGKIEKEYFEPQPKVHGGIIRITPKKEIPEYAKELTKFIKIGFRNPRKKLTNSLKTLFKDMDWNEILSSLNIPNSVRASELTINNWIELFKYYDQYKTTK